MFIEGNLSWDKESERTSLEWPPLMSPRAEAVAQGQPEDEVVLAIDPDLTPAEVDARSIDSLVSAAFFADDPPAPIASASQALEAPAEPRTIGELREVDPLATRGGEAVPFDRDESHQLDEWDWNEDTPEIPARRRPSKRRGPLLVFGTAVTVVLSGGYAAQAFSWRLPPKLRESAQPMKEFLWHLAPARLVGLVANEDRPAPARPLLPDYHDRAAQASSARPQPIHPQAESTSGSLAVPSETGESVAAAPLSQMADPRADTEAWVDRDAPDSEALASATALAAGEIGQPDRTEQPGDERREPLDSTLAVLPQAGPGSNHATPVVSPPPPVNRDHLPRPWHGLVWSPSAQALVPAVPAATPTTQPPMGSVATTHRP